MESKEQALLEEIIENPDDDTPRLIYADWLEERGGPRAEFIRLQCELARLCAPPRDLLRRQQFLLAEHGGQWLDQLSQPLMWYAFRRGFVEDAMVLARDFIERQGRLLEVSPIRLLRTHLISVEQASAFAQVASLRHLHRLQLSTGHEHHVLLFPLLKSSHLANLRRLTLIGGSFDRSRLDELRRTYLGYQGVE